VGRVWLRADGRRRIPVPAFNDRKSSAASISAFVNESTSRVASGSGSESQNVAMQNSPRGVQESNKTQNTIQTQETVPMSCCESGPESSPPSTDDRDTSNRAGNRDVGDSGNVDMVQKQFQEFLKAANKPGALDEKTKRAIAIALSVMARCEPCVKSHIKKARETGFSQEEIDEAAWLAISFAGSPSMVFYNALRRTGLPPE
jgi:AhpD family alkylhydroperoxidase